MSSSRKIRIFLLVVSLAGLAALLASLPWLHDSLGGGSIPRGPSTPLAAAPELVASPTPPGGQGICQVWIGNPRVKKAVVQVKGLGSRSYTGTMLRIPLNPGEWKLSITADGHVPRDVSVKIEAGQSRFLPVWLTEKAVVVRTDLPSAGAVPSAAGPLETTRFGPLEVSLPAGTRVENSQEGSSYVVVGVSQGWWLIVALAAEEEVAPQALLPAFLSSWDEFLLERGIRFTASRSVNLTLAGQPVQGQQLRFSGPGVELSALGAEDTRGRWRLAAAALYAMRDRETKELQEDLMSRIRIR